MKILLMTMSFTMYMYNISLASSQEERVSCWFYDQSHYYSCGIMSDVSLDSVKSICKGIKLHDEELYTDLLQCGGVMMCWTLRDQDNNERSINSSWVISYTNRIAMTQEQSEKAEKSGISPPFGEDACDSLQYGLDKLMPAAIKDLR